MQQLVQTPQLLGKALKRRRKELSLNQSQIGEIFKIEQSTVSSIENGAPGTRLETLFRLLAALDLEMVVRGKEVDPNDLGEW